MNLKARLLKLESSNKIKNDTRDIISYGVITIDNNIKNNGYRFTIVEDEFKK